MSILPAINVVSSSKEQFVKEYLAWAYKGAIFREQKSIITKGYMIIFGSKQMLFGLNEYFRFSEI